MSETANIAAMAEILSGKLLGAFGWKQFGPINFNFQDDTTPDVQRRTKHPCDVIFGYDDPYSGRPTYLITDLKSYAKATITAKDKLESNIVGLGKALQCAKRSKQFKAHLPEESGSINALLFIYNNDNKYDESFADLLTLKAPLTVDIPFESHLYILGPNHIQFLSDVVNDLEKIHGEDTSTIGAFKFFHPNLISKIPERNEWNSAPPTSLISPYITVIYTKEVKTHKDNEITIKTQKNTNFYYRGTGETHEEFCFILDYFFRYSLIDDYQKIKIKMPYSHPKAALNFEKAKHEFLKHFYKQDSGFIKLSQIELTPIPSTMYTFHEIAIGMERRKEFANAN
jgi:hypothetical protein